EYGGGTVMLWDRGTYEPEGGGDEDALRDAYGRGDLKIVFHGERMKGGWVLVRMKREGRPQWLLIKHRDELADSKRDIVAEAATSVTTGRTMEEIGSGRRVWHSNRAALKTAPARAVKKKTAKKGSKATAKKATRSRPAARKARRS